MEKINTVIVGCGAISSVHAQAVQASEIAALYGACDVDKTRLDNFNYCTNKYSSFDDVLADDNVQSVHICTPHYLHADMIVRSVKRGLNVVVEKPVVITQEEALRVYGILDNSNCGGTVSIMAVLQNRFNLCVQKMREMVSDGSRGKLLGIRGQVYWRRDPHYYTSCDWRGKWSTEGGSLVINQAMHTLDLLDYIGGGIREIKGSIDTRLLYDVIETEDTAEATLVFDDGVRGHFYAVNTHCKNEPVEVVLLFENDTLRYTNGNLWDSESNLIAQDSSAEGGGKLYWGNTHKFIIDSFYSSLAGNPKAYTTITEGVRAAELALGLYESAKTGKSYVMKYGKGVE